MSAEILIEDVDVGFRSADYSVFATLSPSTRIEFSPDVDPSYIQILLDSGGDGEDDWIDITELFTFSAGLGEAVIPAEGDIATFSGENLESRALPNDETTIQVVLPGGNRLRYYEHDVLVATAHFLCYDENNRTLPGPDGDALQTVVGDGPVHRAGADCRADVVAGVERDDGRDQPVDREEVTGLARREPHRRRAQAGFGVLDGDQVAGHRPGGVAVLVEPEARVDGGRGEGAALAGAAESGELFLDERGEAGGGVGGLVGVSGVEEAGDKG